MHVGLGGRDAADAGMGIDEGRILALFFGEAGLVPVKWRVPSVKV